MMFVPFAVMNPNEVIPQLKSIQLPPSIKFYEWENVVDASTRGNSHKGDTLGVLLRIR